MGLFKEKERKPVAAAANLAHIDGLNYNRGMVVAVGANLDKLYIRSAVSSKKNPLEQYSLDYSQITNADIVSKQEVVTAQKDAVGGAIVGGLFLGGLGAIIGAASATGTYQTTKKNNYVVINYTPDGGSEAKALSFQILDGDFLYRSWVTSLVNEMRFRIGLPDMEKKKKGAEMVKL